MIYIMGFSLNNMYEYTSNPTIILSDNNLLKKQSRSYLTKDFHINFMKIVVTVKNHQKCDIILLHNNVKFFKKKKKVIVLNVIRVCHFFHV